MREAVGGGQSDAQSVDEQEDQKAGTCVAIKSDFSFLLFFK